MAEIHHKNTENNIDSKSDVGKNSDAGKRSNPKFENDSSRNKPLDAGSSNDTKKGNSDVKDNSDSNEGKGDGKAGSNENENQNKDVTAEQEQNAKPLDGADESEKNKQDEIPPVGNKDAGENDQKTDGSVDKDPNDAPLDLPEDNTDVEDKEKEPEDNTDVEDKEKEPEDNTDVEDKEKEPEDNTDVEDKEKESKEKETDGSEGKDVEKKQSDESDRSQKNDVEKDKTKEKENGKKDETTKPTESERLGKKLQDGMDRFNKKGFYSKFGQLVNNAGKTLSKIASVIAPKLLSLKFNLPDMAETLGGTFVGKAIDKIGSKASEKFAHYLDDKKFDKDLDKFFDAKMEENKPIAPTEDVEKVKAHTATVDMSDFPSAFNYDTGDYKIGLELPDEYSDIYDAGMRDNADDNAVKTENKVQEEKPALNEKQEPKIDEGDNKPEGDVKETEKEKQPDQEKVDNSVDKIDNEKPLDLVEKDADGKNNLDDKDGKDKPTKEERLEQKMLDGIERFNKTGYYSKTGRVLNTAGEGLSKAAGEVIPKIVGDKMDLPEVVEDVGGKFMGDAIEDGGKKLSGKVSHYVDDKLMERDIDRYLDLKMDNKPTFDTENVDEVNSHTLTIDMPEHLKGFNLDNGDYEVNFDTLKDMDGKNDDKGENAIGDTKENDENKPALNEKQEPKTDEGDNKTEGNVKETEKEKQPDQEKVDNSVDKIDNEKPLDLVEKDADGKNNLDDKDGKDKPTKEERLEQKMLDGIERFNKTGYYSKTGRVLNTAGEGLSKAAGEVIPKIVGNQTDLPKMAEDLGGKFMGDAIEKGGTKLSDKVSHYVDDKIMDRDIDRYLDLKMDNKPTFDTENVDEVNSHTVTIEMPEHLRGSDYSIDGYDVSFDGTDNNDDPEKNRND